MSCHVFLKPGRAAEAQQNADLSLLLPELSLTKPDRPGQAHHQAHRTESNQQPTKDEVLPLTVHVDVVTFSLNDFVRDIPAFSAHHRLYTGRNVREAAGEEQLVALRVGVQGLHYLPAVLVDVDVELLQRSHRVELAGVLPG